LSALLLDASVWLAALDRDDRFHSSARQLVEGGAEGDLELAALDLTLYEVANVAVVRWGSRSIARRLVELVQLSCPGTLERVDADLAAEMVTLAEEHGMTVYDAAYVATAARRDWVLVSGDLADLVRPGHAAAPDAVDPRHGQG
jgi:predicted nucleic acid-binding protein